MWGWVKRWFDPVTVSKIFILSQQEVFPTLSSYIDVQNIPKQYGGQLDFAWCQMPNLDPKIKALATWENGFTEFPKGPIYWVPVEGGKRMAALARGTVDKKERNTRVCTIPVAFAEEEEEDEEEFKDAPEEPTDLPGVQNLSLQDDAEAPLSEKAVEVAPSSLPNGKAEAAAA